jgi:RHS repeat-associated protein
MDEETGLYYFGARYLDPVRGRWVSTDPILGEYIGNDPKRLANDGVYRPLTLSVYGNSAFSPLSRRDPDGLADVLVTISGTQNGRFAYSWAYPDGNYNLAYRTPLYSVTVSAKTDAGVTRSVTFDAIRFGPRNDRDKMSVAGLAEEQTHTLRWYPEYMLHSTGSAENGAWIVKGNFLIHDGPDGPDEVFGTAGCVEIYGQDGFSRFNKAMLDLSGEKNLKDVKAKARYERARRPTLKEFPVETPAPPPSGNAPRR